MLDDSVSAAELAAIPAFVAARQIWATGVEVEGAERGRFGLSLLTERFWDNRMAKLRSCVEGRRL